MASLNVNQVLQLAVQHHQAGRLVEAEKLYRQVLVSEPAHPDALHLLGMLAMNAGKFDEAEALINRAIAVMPNIASYKTTLAGCRERKAAWFTEQARSLRSEGKLQEAWKSASAAIAADPQFAGGYNALGACLREANDWEGAVAAFSKAVELRPEFADAQNNLGATLSDKKLHDRAIVAYQNALKVKPKHGETHHNLSLLYSDQGRVDEALSSLESGMEALPESPKLASSHLFLLEGDAAITPERLFQEHRRWDEKFGWKGTPEKHLNNPDPNRRLRIGYVSGDIKKHAIMTFARVLFDEYSPTETEIFCYASSPGSDEMTELIRKKVSQWRDISTLSDEQADQLIRQDQIDILVDLNAHTGDSRLILFSRKPAPVQVTYLGYPDTTGLSAMDYRLTDGYADPPGQTEGYHSEELVRLPSTFLCFSPRDFTQITWQPRESIMFGSFNALRKVNDGVVELWAEILRSVPGSRLTLKASGTASDSCKQSLTERFGRLGVEADRLVILPWAKSHDNHLELYNNIDIGLDPFPYNGTTTTADAFWMGLPIVALEGKTHRERVSVSMLTNLGLPELIAKTREEYVRIGVELANDLPRLTGLRRGLREQMTQSPLMDRAGFMRDLEAAYRGMWQRWCRRADRAGVHK